MSDTPVVRMPPLDPAAYSEAQKRAEADFRATRNVGFSGPWHVLIRSPELLTHAQHMGSYLRYRCSLSGRLSETAILLVAREWTQDFEFGEHRKYALQAGVADATIEAIRHGRRPQLEGDDLLVYDFVTELLRTRRVSDATYAAARERFGEEGVVDLAGITGYYSLLAMAMNVARVGPPAGEPRLPRFPE
jgi:4-carboxymuconolactone decarboxylase